MASYVLQTMPVTVMRCNGNQVMLLICTSTHVVHVNLIHVNLIHVYLIHVYFCLGTARRLDCPTCGKRCLTGM